MSYNPQSLCQEHRVRRRAAQRPAVRQLAACRGTHQALATLGLAARGAGPARTPEHDVRAAAGRRPGHRHGRHRPRHGPLPAARRRGAGPGDARGRAAAGARRRRALLRQHRAPQAALLPSGGRRRGRQRPRHALRRQRRGLPAGQRDRRAAPQPLQRPSRPCLLVASCHAERGEAMHACAALAQQRSRRAGL